MTNGPITSATFTGPTDVAIDGYGNLYVDEYYSADIRKITPAGVVSTFAGSGSAGFVNGTGTAASFNNPGGMTVDALGNIYLADYNNSVIRKITPAGVVTTLAGGGMNGYTGTGTTAAFTNVFGIVIDASGNLYANNAGTANISKVTTTGYSISPSLPPGLFFDATTGTISGTPLAATTAATYTIIAYNTGGSSTATVSIAATGSITPVTPPVKAPVISYASPQSYTAGTAITALLPSNTGGAVPGQFYSLASVYIPGSLGNNTLGIVIDASNNLYYCSGTSVYKVGTTGSPYIFAGSGATGFTNGTGAGATFSTLAGLAIDVSGNIYVADNGNNAIRKITPAGIVTTIAGNGTAGHNDGTGTVATFNSPNGIAMDAFGNLAVTESGNSDIRRISPAGVVTTLAGGTGGNTNGTGTAASFSNPEGIAIDGSGNMYIADFYNNLIRKITPAGVVTTLAGSGNSANTNGTGTAASFNNPQGIAVDPAGNVYVADFTNQLLRKITPAAVVTTLAGGGPNGISAAGSEFNFGGQPNGLAIDAAGNLYTNVGSNIDKVTSTGYTISPALPADLVFSPSTGALSGTPTVATAATVYTVNAYNIGGSASTAINITVTGVATPPATVAAPVISYTTPQSYTSGTAIAALMPTNTGGAVPADIYGQVSTFAGSTAAGWVDGAALNAAFNSPSAVATDAFGYIYVADNNNYVIRKISPAGVVTTLAGNGTSSFVNGTGTAAGFSTIQSLAVDNSGNVYVADIGNYSIRKINASGVVTTLAGSGSSGSGNGTGTSASFGSPFSLAVTAAGVVYVADTQNNLIRQVTAAGVVTTFAGSGSPGSGNGTGTAASFNTPSGIAVNSSGNLFVSDQNNSLIRKITSAQVVSVFAGSGSPGSQDGTGTGASFSAPGAITIDAAANLYVADNNNYIIRKITTAAVVTTLAGYGGNGGQVINGVGTAAAFTTLLGLAADRTGDIFIAESSDNTIRELTVAGYVISGNTLPAGVKMAGTTGAITGTPTSPQAATSCTITAYNGGGSSSATVSFAVTGSVISPTVVQAPAITYQTPQSYTAGTALTTLLPANTGVAVPAQIYSQVTTEVNIGVAFDGVSGVAVDASGNIYTSSPPDNAIYKTNTSGVTSVYAGLGYVGGTGSANGTGTAASFNGPRGIAIDAAGNLYVADYSNNMIRKITPNGTVSTLAGNTTAGSMNGTGTGASFNGPYGVAVDGLGNVFVADANNNMIRMITPAGVVSTLAGNTTPGSGNGTGIAASFNSPEGLTVDANDNVYVADYGNNLIRKITSAAVVSTVAGTGSAGNLNGTGTAASFNGPLGITLDAVGNLYIGDVANELIREISPAGVVSTLAGGANAGLINGTGINSSFNNPNGLAFGSSGTLYVADGYNNAVRLVNLTGYTITPALPAGIAFNGTTGAISGTPEAASPAANYTVTGYNAGGSSSAVLNITVTGSITPPALTVAAPNISYTGPQAYTVGTTISALSPINTGGAVPASIYSQVTTVNGQSSNMDVVVTTDAAGNLYAAVGSFGASQIEKITPSGVVSVLAGSNTTGNANGVGTSASFGSINGLAADASGNIYVADGNNNLIRKVTPAGVVTTLAGSGAAGRDDGEGINSSFSNPAGVALDNFGNVYVSDNGNNTIRKISPSGVVATLAGGLSAGFVNGTGAGALFSGPQGLTVDGYGNVYVADYNNNAIREISPGGVVTTLAGTNISGNTNGTGAAASFNNPKGVTIDATGNLYVADYNNALVRKITPAGVVTTLAGSGAFGFNNGTGTEASFYQPSSIAIDASGNLELGEDYYIEKISHSGYTISPALPAGLTFDGTTGIIAGTPEAAVPAANYAIIAYNAGGSSTATLNITTSGTITPPAPSVAAPNITYTNPAAYSAGVTITPLAPVNTGGGVPASIYATVGIAQGQPAIYGQAAVTTDASGNFYTVSGNQSQVIKVTLVGAVTIFAGAGVSGYLDGTGTNAYFSGISGLATDAAGNVYVSDGVNDLVRKITPAGVVSTLAGSGASGRDDGTGKNASFNNPAGVAVDNFGNVYVADNGNNLIRKISPSGVVITLAGGGSGTATNGTGTAATFSSPRGIALDGYGNLYVADFGNCLIREVTPAGVVTTFAGTGSPGTLNGTGTAASFTYPAGIAADAIGNLYVADYQDYLVRKITPGALVTTLAGSGTGTTENGTGTSASFFYPYGIAIDPSGNIYVTEGNAVMAKINAVGYTINATLPAGLTFDGTTGTITGTPLAAFASANYTVAAYNLGGSSTATITLSCTGTATAPALPAAPAISYASPQTYAVGIPITALPPSNTGGAVPPGIYGAVTTFAGSGTAGANNGTGTAASFSGLAQMATDIYGNLYVIDAGNYAIRKITPSGVVTILAGGSSGNTNGTGAAASFGSLNGIAVDASSNVYVSDISYNVIRKITPAGVVTTLAGSGTPGFANGAGAAASFNEPEGLAVVGTNIFVCDLNNYMIRKITATGVVSTFAGSGSQGQGNGAGTAASFQAPQQIAADKNGNLYVSDAYYTIRKITPGAGVSTFAGSGAPGADDGAGIVASFNEIYGLTTDAAANIYVSDGQNNLIRKVTSAGVVTTIAGSYNLGFANGVGTAASFNGPEGIAADASGNLYIADINNNVIRDLIINGYTINSDLPYGLTINGATGVITGTPTVVTPVNSYTVTANNAGGSATAAISITVRNPPVVTTTTTVTVFSDMAGAAPVTVDAGVQVTDASLSTLASGTVSITGNFTSSQDVLAFTNNPSTMGNIAGTYTASTGVLALTSSGATATTAQWQAAFEAVTYNNTNSTNPVTASRIVSFAVNDGTFGSDIATKTISINFTPSNNASLSSLSVSQGTLSPAFASGTTAYSISVGNAITSLTVTPVTANSNATVTVNGTAVISGSASAAIPLAVGSNTVTVIVTAQDNVTTGTYTLTVIRTVTQTITFAATNTASYGTPDFSPGATSTNSTIPITYTSSNTAVATISGSGDIHVISAGTTTITASQAGNTYYTAATPVNQTLTITRAALTVTATSETTTYGAGIPALQITYSGFVNNDTQTSLTTQPTITTTATASSPAGNYPITVSGAADANYTISYVAGTLTIGQAALTVIATSESRVYGAAMPALAVTYSGFVNGDTQSSLSTQPTITSTASASSPVGSYPITASGAADANYSISYSGGTLTVTPAPLTITATSLSKTYGSANPTLAVTYTGLVNGDTKTSLTTQPTITTTATASSPTGTYPITASAAADANYTISYVAGTLKVNPAALTITATNESKTYGAANPTLAVTYSGFVNGDTQTSLTTQPTIATTATAASPAGTYPITASAAVDANYTISYVAGTLTVGQAALTITATNESKIYGAANPTLAVTYSGFVNGDSQTSLTTQPTIATTATASSPAGKYPITASGAVDANYTISYVAGTLIVGQAALTITATNENKIYGAANPTLAVTYNGFVNGDTQSSLTTQPTITTTATASSAVGTYPITASGAAATNYTISYVAGTLTVGQAALTITATNESKTYGAANPTLAVTYNGFVNGDTQSSVTTQPTIATTATASSPAGTYPITASGAAAANYTISYTAGTLTVGQAALTITATNESKSYGAAIPTLPATYSGFVNGDTQASLTTQPTITTTATAASPTGTYPITASSAVDANYAITYAAGTLTITPVALTITANNQTKSLGTANPALTATYTGLVNGDTQASLTTQPTITTTATNSSPVGSYPITASAATDPNYTISYAAGTLSVTTSTSDAYLNNLTLTTATLSPAFTFSTLTYTASVANATASITVTPTVSEAGSTITVNGTAVTSGSASGAIALSVGANTITTIVTAPNGTNTETYTETVTRAPATNAKLSYLGLSQVTLSPAFATATTSYTASVANTIATTNVEPIEVGPGATIKVNGVAVASGATTPVALSVGNTTINTVVTAQDGVTQLTYTVVVTRAAASVATLNNLTVSGATLSPTFATTTTSYTATVGNAVTSITITPTTTASNATVTVNGTAVTSGSASGAIALSVGANTITTVVTAGNGTTTDTYTTTVTRTPASNAKLSYLGLSQVTLSPAFASTTTSYTASVANTISSTNVEPIEIGPGATIAVNGVAVASGATTPVTLSVGTNTINTVVTAQDGVTKITYTVTVTRAPSAIATLSNITLNSGTLSPAFASTKTSYTASVGNTLTSITETPTTTDPTATVTVNGTAVTSGSPSGAIALSVGANTITTVITAGNGTTTDTYTVTVTRAPSSNAKLSYLGLSKVTLSPTFATATTSYTASVANSITSTNVEGITVDPTATIAVNGVAVASGSTTPVALNVGANTINTVVTAQDGVTQITYAVTVTRAAPAGAYVVYDPISVEKPADSPQLEDDGIVVHQGVSPNGDGIDDYLQIDNITNYPDNKLTIINRSGMLIYEAKGYDNSSRTFDGHSNKNGQMQLPGTYFYSLDYNVGGIIKHRTGYIVLKY